MGDAFWFICMCRLCQLASFIHTISIGFDSSNVRLTLFFFISVVQCILLNLWAKNCSLNFLFLFFFSIKTNFRLAPWCVLIKLIGSKRVNTKFIILILLTLKKILNLFIQCITLLFLEKLYFIFISN